MPSEDYHRSGEPHRLPAVLMITGVHIREARRLLGWSELMLCSKAHIRPATLARAESPDGLARRNRGQLIKLTRALETAGVIFVEENGEGRGVRLRREPA